VPVQNAEVAAMSDQAAELPEIEGENQSRVRAYRRAARTTMRSAIPISRDWNGAATSPRRR